MNTKRIWALGMTLISLLSLFLWGAHASPARAQTGDGVNLLVDGDFETHTEGQTWP